jgi:hypothetical protein
MRKKKNEEILQKTGLQTGLHIKKVPKSNLLKIKNPSIYWGFESSEREI